MSHHRWSVLLYVLLLSSTVVRSSPQTRYCGKRLTKALLDLCGAVHSPSAGNPGPVFCKRLKDANPAIETRVLVCEKFEIIINGQNATSLKPVAGQMRISASSITAAVKHVMRRSCEDIVLKSLSKEQLFTRRKHILSCLIKAVSES